jgi:hypothetical protein
MASGTEKNTRAFGHSRPVGWQAPEEENLPLSISLIPIQLCNVFFIPDNKVYSFIKTGISKEWDL